MNLKEKEKIEEKYSITYIGFSVDGSFCYGFKCPKETDRKTLREDFIEVFNIFDLPLPDIDENIKYILNRYYDNNLNRYRGTIYTKEEMKVEINTLKHHLEIFESIIEGFDK